MMKQKNMKQTKVVAKVFVLALMMAAVWVSSLTTEAASKKAKAIKAYNRMLSKSSFNVDTNINNGNSRKNIIKYQTKNCNFGLAYIDNDSIPELIVFDKDELMISHATGYGAMFTYRNGRVKQIAALHLNQALRYYKKKGVYIDHFSGMASFDYYNRIKGGKVSDIGTKMLDWDYNTGKKKIKYYNSNSKKISKKSFDRNIKKYVKSAKPVEAHLYENTSENRKNYLK